ncbi:helix-turn-helix transcriptional regulator [Streptosporangium sandarakinum]|uniref:helix-turn-helix transcriptional regulator n=1 Tax=Streptosporangium TaxID=2000 RepID=UPI0031F7B18B
MPRLPPSRLARTVDQGTSHHHGQWGCPQQRLRGFCGRRRRRPSLSRAAFARRFTHLVGQPPLTYLTWWRMTTAARLLRASDAPVNTIAQQAGHSSQYTFTHAFKRQYGSPPGSYRHHAG